MGTPPLIGDPATLGEALRAAAEQFGDREAYVDGFQRISFAGWVAAAGGLAVELADRGVRRGNVVALMLPSSIDYAVCYAAIASLGAVTTGLNTRLGVNEVTAVLATAAPALVIRDTEAGLPEVPEGIPVMARSELAAACLRRPGGGPAPDVDPADPVVVIWTSGTTGVPKGAWFDHRNLAAAARSAGVMSAPFDRRLVATPFAHAGYMAKLWDQLAWGITMVVGTVPWSAAEMAQVLIDERITVAGGVPTQWSKLLEQPHLAGRRLEHLRVGIAATAPAAPELVERVADLLGVPLVVRYAMTESPSICGTEPTDPPEVQARTVGRPQAGVQVRVVDDDGGPVATETVGRVQVRGDCVMRGYWRAPELTAQVLGDDGWLRSGDLGRLTAEGNLVLVGRSGDMYIRGGYNVYPLEVENVLADHPAVARVAVVGVPAPVIGEIGVAFVVPADPAAAPTREELRVWVRGHLADYKAPDRVETVPDLPLTAMQKIDKLALRELALG
ncbi:class I adenylate-forming enzyme family protein [uncultured Modestobacter sp.]|uniref:class I adenylate-forming enzyme family protein n=1 Tax=uncultured Modestobacter sp. TaxID=380048 RepID=UPI00261E68DB|nr:class I adenylate-forming enzyme family protein [uncultured Modestobacter sp.]